MAKEQLNARISTLTRRQLNELGERWGTSQTETLTVIIDRQYRQETTMSEKYIPARFALGAWMTVQHIAAARRIFENEIGYAMTPEHKRGAEEGLACMEDAQPEYLMNLLPQDHPDRKEAFRILSEYTPFVDTPHKDI